MYGASLHMSGHTSPNTAMYECSLTFLLSPAKMPVISGTINGPHQLLLKLPADNSDMNIP